MITLQTRLQGISIGSTATVAIRELTGLQTIDLRVAPGTAAHAAVAQALGVDLPAKPGQIIAKTTINGTEAHAFCLAPDWWLMVGLGEAGQQIANLLPLQAQHHFSAVDVTGQRTGIELEGPHAREVLAHLWEQDLRDKSFPVGSVSQGLMAKAPVIVCYMAPFRYRVMVRSSFALHLWQALVDAAEEYL
jgi:sarcosine oxidase, subunit gamma